MFSAGIIVNPSSGKDIRRIVAAGRVVTNQEKLAITRRLLHGLEEAGVERVYYMPEPGGICPAALESTALEGLALDIPVTGRQEDSTLAARLMAEREVGCIITLGGDGTNRAVFKGSGPGIPLLPVSTGTNNVFPEFQEGTTAGFAAGLVAAGRVDLQKATWRSKALHLLKEGQLIDLALVDLAVTLDTHTGARAIWEADRLVELFLTRAQPWSIGLSAIGGFIHPVLAEEPVGLYLVFGTGGRRARVPIGPGRFIEVEVNRSCLLKPGEGIDLVVHRQAVLAFDGERERITHPGEVLRVEISPEGPLVIDVPRTLLAAAQASR